MSEKTTELPTFGMQEIEVEPGSLLIIGKQAFTVPAGVTRITVTVFGSGGDGSDAIGQGGGTTYK